MFQVWKQVVKRLQPAARQVLKDPKQAEAFMAQVEAKAQGQEERLQELGSDLKGFLRMLRSYFSGHYRNVPYKVVLSGSAALLYFLNPFDLIPDVLLGGWLDDLMVMGWVFRSIRVEVQRFRDFEATPA